MNLIDHYNSAEPLSSYRKVDDPAPEHCPEDWAFDIERKPHERGLPCYLVFMREHFEKKYPRASVRIFEDSIQQERKEPKFMASVVHEPLRYGHFQVYNELVIDQVGQSVLLKGTFMLNHQFIKISNRQQIYMALRKAAKLNLELSPLRIALSPLEGSIELMHCSYVDCKFGVLNNSYKNIVYFTERMGSIMHKINCEIDTLFYFLQDDSLLRFYSGKLEKHIREGREMVSTMENSLYLTHFSNSNMDYMGKVQVIDKCHQRFSEDVSQIMKVFGVDAQKVQYCKPNQIHSFSSEKYPQETVGELATQIDQHIKFRVYSKIQFYDDKVIWRELEEYSGNCKIQYAHVRFSFLNQSIQRPLPNKKQNIPENDDDTDTLFVKETSLQSLVEAKLTRKSFQRNKAKMQREKGVVRNLKGKSHPNVMTFLESDSPGDKQFIYTLFEENQSLDRFVQKCMILSFYQKLFMLEQAAKGLLFIHRSSILHLDYKPANLIVGKKYLVKVCDFGQSCTVSQKKGHKFGTTFPFAPPQVYSMRKGQISQKVDIYALGVTMYLCLFSRHIWGAIRSKTQFIFSLKQGVLSPTLIPQHYSDLPCSKVARILVLLCLKCISSSPQCRPTLLWIVTYLQRMRVCLQHMHYK